MDKYANFKHLDAFYKKIAQSSGFDVEDNDSLLINTGLNDAVFNYVRFHSLASTVWKEILHKLKLPFIAFPNREMNEKDLSEFAATYEFKKLGEVIAHTYQGLHEFTFEKMKPNLEVKLVDRAEEIDAVDLLSSLSLHHPQEYMKTFIRGIPRAGFKVDDLFCFIAYLDGVPVGQSFLAIHNNVPGLYFASVHPEYRKQGVETEMVKTRMAFARDLGFDQMVVQCMASSVNLFQRLGFKPHGSLALYLHTPTRD